LENLYKNKLENFEETPKFLEAYDIQNWTKKILTT
jgi:hypothetical protein